MDEKKESKIKIHTVNKYKRTQYQLFYFSIAIDKIIKFENMRFNLNDV